MPEQGTKIQINIEGRVNLTKESAPQQQEQQPARGGIVFESKPGELHEERTWAEQQANKPTHLFKDKRPEWSPF